MVFSSTSAKRLFSFGGYLFLSGILYAVYTRIYSLLIGKLYGVRDLGLYSRADSLQQTSSGVISDVIGRVAFPAFSSVSGDLEKLGRGVRLAVKGTMLINVPAMLGLMAISDPLVKVLFGEQWLPSVPILRVLCISAIFLPLHVINLNTLKALGYSSLFFRLELMKNVLGITLLVVGSYFGVMGIAWGSVGFGLLAFLINAYFTGKLLGYGSFKQAIDIAPTVIISTFMAVALMWLDNFMQYSEAMKLLILAVAGACIFTFAAIICQLDALRQVLDFVRMNKVNGNLT